MKSFYNWKDEIFPSKLTYWNCIVFIRSSNRPMPTLLHTCIMKIIILPWNKGVVILLGNQSNTEDVKEMLMCTIRRTGALVLRFPPVTLLFHTQVSRICDISSISVNIPSVGANMFRNVIIALNSPFILWMCACQVCVRVSMYLPM